MARSDLLVSLVRAAASGDTQAVKSTAEAIAADERAKNHHILADRLQRAVSTVSVSPSALTSWQETVRGSGREAIIEASARVRLDELFLPLPAIESGRQLIEEHARAGVLRAHGYEPRHRILLSGPPGNGKTSFAEAIAEGLSLPYFVVRYDALIGSYLGETNTRLRNLFDYVRTRPSVLFFDEFDAIGKERGDTHETGEIKRVVSFLLMQLDQLPSYVVVVAATNHAELLDRAVWRRFQMRISLPAPTSRQIESLLDRTINRWPQRPRWSPHKIAETLGPVSYAEALDFCQNVRRRNILGMGEGGIDEALATEIELWLSRARPAILNGQRSDQAITQTGPTPATKPRNRKTQKNSKD